MGSILGVFTSGVVVVLGCASSFGVGGGVLGTTIGSGSGTFSMLIFSVSVST